MPRDVLFRFLRQRLHWLLCLALLLPLAQLITAAHASMHATEAAQASDGATKSRLPHCPMCNAAAMLGAAALPDTPAPVVLPEAAAARQAATPSVPAAAPHFGLPANRGPPASLS